MPLTEAEEKELAGLDARFATADAADPTEPVSKTEAFAIGAEQTISRGLSDEIRAAFKSGIPRDAGGIGFRSNEVFDPVKADEELRDRLEREQENLVEEREKIKAAQTQQSGAFAAGEIGAGIATGFVPGLGALKAITGSARIGRFAAEGAAQAFGRGEELEERIADAGFGAFLGAVTGGIAQGVVGKAVDIDVGSAVRNSNNRLLQNAALGTFGVKAQREAVSTGEKLARNSLKKIGKELELVNRESLKKFEGFLAKEVDVNPTAAAAAEKLSQVKAPGAKDAILDAIGFVAGLKKIPGIKTLFGSGDVRQRVANISVPKQLGGGGFINRALQTSSTPFATGAFGGIPVARESVQSRVQPRIESLFGGE